MQNMFKLIFGILNVNGDMGIMGNRARGSVRLMIAMALLIAGAMIMSAAIVFPALHGLSRIGIVVPMIFPLAFLVGAFEFVTDKPWHSMPKALRLLALIIGVFVTWIVLAVGAINLALLVRP